MDLTKLIKTRSNATNGDKPLNILFATSEIAPFSKTGGLGDVSASLPKELARRGHQVVVFTPLYKHLDPEKMRLSRRLMSLDIPQKSKNQKKVQATIWEGRLDHGARIFFLDYEPYFQRDGLYGDNDQEYSDNAARFALFCRAVVEFMLQFSLPIDVLHCNDWHTALAPVYLKQYYAKELSNVSCVLTIHNLAFQGKFGRNELSATGLPKKFDSPSELIDGDSINFLKGGILYADKVAAVSPTYAQEIQEESGGFGLHELLQQRKDDLHGILNGADYSIWSPDVDRHIAIKYDVDSLNHKRRNKAELQHKMGLPIRPTLPLLGIVSRLTEQKGMHILLPVLKELLASFESEQAGFQLVVLGEGQQKFKDNFALLAQQYPKRVAFEEGYHDKLAHQIQAGCDLLLIPSQFEPCGLTQLYAMRYGTLPLVHSTGGLADTVRDISEGEDGPTSGFVFNEFTPGALKQCIERAIVTYKNYKKWRPLMVRAMKQDFSWASAATDYENLYREILKAPQK